MAAVEPGFIVNGKRYEVPTDLTMGEMCDAEQHFGVEFGNNKSSGVRLAAALLWIAIRRDDPTVTPEDIRELPPEVFETLGSEDDALPPVSAADDVLTGNAETSTNESSGSSSNHTGDVPEELPERIGTQA